MNKLSLSFMVKVIVIILLYYILDALFDDTIIIIVLVSFILLYILYILIFKTRDNQKLEIMCDAPGYLSLLTKKYSKRNNTYSDLYFAYGYVYNGEYDKALELIQKYDVTKLNEENRYIWYNISLKIAFHNNDRNLYMGLYQKMKESSPSKKFMNELDVAKAPIYILEENYEDLIAYLMDLIPKQLKRFRIVELEYYLALAYYKGNWKEDGLAITEFMLKKNYQLIYHAFFEELQKELEKE
ncbi:MAG: hypothetical protein JXR62_01075 [Bacilli bacterium]|nr:hypothetical protein [Bacilli bacterium]